MKKSLLLTALVILLAILPYPASSQGWNIDSVGTCYNLWGELRCAEISGDYAYLGSYNTGLRVVNISDSTNLHEVGFCLTPETVISIAISGDYAYLVDQHLQIADVSDPTHPVIVGTYDPEVTFYYVTVSGIYAYATTREGAAGDYEFRTMDISSPANPQETGFCPLSGMGNCITLVDHYAYVGVAPNSMVIIDVSDPHSPYQVAQREVQTIRDIAASDGIVCAASFSGLHVFDSSNPSLPQQVGLYNDSPWLESVAACGDYFCVTAEHSMEIIDVSDPTNPQRVGSILAHDIPYDVSVINNTAYLLEVAGFYRAIEISDPANPIEISQLSNGGEVSDVAVTGDYAITVDYWPEDGLRVIDISNPYDPFEIDRCQIPNQFPRIRISGNYAYVGHWAVFEAGVADAGVRIVDISDPTDPFQVGLFDSQRGDLRDLAIQDSLLYVVNISELLILNISDPTHPTELCSFDPGGSYYMGVEGNYLYLCTGSHVNIVDASDPYNPFVAGNYDPSATPRDIVASGHYAYLGTSAGLQVLDISDPIYTQQIGICPDAPGGQKIVKSGDHVFIIDTSSRLVAIDVSDPTNPTVSGYHDSRWYPEGFDVSGQYAYVGDGVYTSIYDCSAALSVPEDKSAQIPTSVTLFPAYPDPFNPTTTIRFALPVSEKVTLNIYDITGRHVATLFDGFREAGTHNVMFDGSGLSSGVYFCQMTAGTSRKVQKMVLLK